MGSGNKPIEKPQGRPSLSGSATGSADAPKPDWADGLKKLYDSVVDEPIPDNFKDLLAKLDESAESGES